MMANSQAKQSEPISYAFEAARLRWAGLKDCSELVSLYNEARENKLETYETMTDWLEHGGGLILEDETGKMLCALRWREEGEGWQVDRIATLPEARGRSYGRWLMTKVEALAIRRNIPTLMLFLDDTRDELLYYYQRMGYQLESQAKEGGWLTKRVGGTWQFKA
jgi:GNAT superfamily N-acetyltransferase